MAQEAELIDLTDPDDTQEVVNELRAHFSRVSIWKFERFLGDGEYAIAVLVKEVNPFVTGRRMVVKRAKGKDSEAQLRREIHWLTRLRGSEHVVGLLAARDDTQARRVVSNFLRLIRHIKQVFQCPASLAFRGILGPIIGMEYMENGTMTRLVQRLEDKDVHLPNRVLWSFFLCLVRACVALAYPPDGAAGEATKLETIPTNGQGPINVTHGDLHSGNIMIGTTNPKIAEHSLVPAAKFIDLGETTENNERGLTENLYKISVRMLVLIVRREVRIRRAKSQYQGFETLATEILPHGNGANYPTLDPDLRALLARCLRVNPADRPGLQEMLQTAERAVRDREAAHYEPNEALETDDAINRTLQEVLYDADPPAASSDSSMPSPTFRTIKGPGPRIFGTLHIPRRRR